MTPTIEDLCRLAHEASEKLAAAMEAVGKFDHALVDYCKPLTEPEQSPILCIELAEDLGEMQGSAEFCYKCVDRTTDMISPTLRAVELDRQRFLSVVAAFETGLERANDRCPCRECTDKRAEREAAVSAAVARSSEAARQM